MATQSVKHLTLEISLGLGLRVMSSSPSRGAYLEKKRKKKKTVPRNLEMVLSH